MTRLAFWVTLPLLMTLALCAPPKVDATPREQAVEIICTYEWDCGVMVAIVGRESGYDQYAVNRDCNPREPYQWVCWGWFQHILPAGVDGSWLFDPRLNTERAYSLWLSDGLRPWCMVKC